MALFEVPNRPNKEADKLLAKKVKVKAKQPAVRKVGLVDSINLIRNSVDKYLGKYKDDYEVIRDLDSLEKYLIKSKDNNIISIDTETTGLDPITDKIVGMCLYTPGEKALYVPINHTSYITNERVDNQLTEEQVGSLFNKYLTGDIKIVMFNAKFDIRVMRNQLNVYVKCYWDCSLAARLLNENEPEGKRGLKDLHQKYVLNDEEDEFSFDALFRGITFDKIPIDVGYLYAAHDAVVTYELYEFQKQYLDVDSDREDMRNIAKVFFNIEMPCIEVVCDMEDTGVALDLSYSTELANKYHNLLEEKKNKFYRICDDFGQDLDAYRAKEGVNNKLEYPINISSSSQIAIMLYDVLKIEPPDISKPRGTGESILLRIDHPVVKAILEYREVKKLLDTYIDKLPKVINPKDGRIHCNFNQYGADTGRFSSSDPNLQNIPSRNHDIRKMFIATEGYVLMSSDYSQQEPKIMTQMCGDPEMIKAYKEGKDLYAQIASLAFNESYEECLEFRPDGTVNKEGKERRSSAKSILLGILYGRGINSIAEQLKTTKEKAKSIQDKIFKGFPAIPKFEKDSLQMAYDLGYVTTLWGRKRRLPDLQLDEFEFKWKDGVAKTDDLLDFDEEISSEVPETKINYYLRKLHKAWGNEKKKIIGEALRESIVIVDNGAKISDARRQCVNARIQGSAADMSKLAMIKVGTDERLKELGFRLLIPVHDELIAECPIENVKECSERFAELMDIAAGDKLTIPISCDVEITKQWYGERIDI